MGWNAGYEIMEATVVGAYDLGVLDKRLLKVLMEPYRDSDIDSGGSNDLTAKDGLDLREIVLAVHGVEVDAPKPKPKSKNQDAWDVWHDALSDAFYELTSKHYGW
jgi:hypothetical protein